LLILFSSHCAFVFRLTVGADKGGYYHELFLRNRVDLVATIQRVKVKGTGVRAKANPSDEPNLYSFQPVDKAASQAVADMAISNDVKVAAALIPEKKVPSLSPPNQMLPSPMMMVTRDYDSVQESLEQNAERLIADQTSKPYYAVAPKAQSLYEQVTSTGTPMELMAESKGSTADVSFDRLIDEMFRHDQSLDFSELLKLAAV